MKRKFLLNALIISALGGALLVTSCGGSKQDITIPDKDDNNNSDNNDNENVDPEKPNGGDENKDPVDPNKPDTPTVKKYLTIDTTKVKLNYYVGDIFDKTNLVVKLVTVTNGVKDEGVVTTKYHLSVADDQPLTMNDREIMVVSDEENVKSTSFEITITKKPISKDAIYNAVKNLRDQKSYEVTTTIGNNTIKGTVAKNGVVWTSNELDYYYDDGYGYSEYEGLTFRFEYNPTKIESGTYILDLHGIDNGLYNSETLDGFQYRISNYSANNMTDAELEYIKNAPMDSENRIKVDPAHAKWIFNVAGHKLGSYNPDVAFVNGVAYVSLNDDGDLTLETIPAKYSNLEGMGSISTVKNVGSTTIPALDAFLKNPTFTPSIVDRDLLKVKDAIDARNYTITSTIEGVEGFFTEDYSVIHNATRDKKNPSSIAIKENNKFNLKPNLYRLTESKYGFQITDKDREFGMSYKSTVYLDAFPLFEDLMEAFTLVSPNNYSWVIKVDTTTPDENVDNPTGNTAAIGYEYYTFAEAFVGGIPEDVDHDIVGTIYQKFDLKINKENGVLKSFDISVYGDNGDGKGNVLLGTVTISNIGTTKYEKLDKWITKFVY